MLHSFEEKLERADQHLKELWPELRRWVQSRPYRILDKVDPNTGDNILYGQLLRSPPSIFPN
jgi:hypothetical protein